MKMARLLLSHSADVFAHFAADGWTALHSACHGGHNHMAQLLLQEADFSISVFGAEPFEPFAEETSFCRKRFWEVAHLWI